MQHHVAPATHYWHLDLLAGSWTRIPLGYLPERQPQILSAMMRSRELGGTAALFDDRLLLEVDFSYDGAGVAALGLAAHVAMGDGIEPRTRLFFGTCAASPIFSDEIYGSVGRYYLNAMLGRPKWRMPSLPGDFPAEHPWAASFLYPEAAQQSWQFRYELIERIRVLMAVALNHCRISLASNEDPHPEDRMGPNDRRSNEEF